MRSERTLVKHFIAEPVTILFHEPPAITKKPTCPNGFVWCEETFTISACLSEWQDFSRRGRMAQNMQPQHARVASLRGSWGVGRFYFDVQTHDERRFRLYYDRAPKDAVDRTGHWFLLAELANGDGS